MIKFMIGFVAYLVTTVPTLFLRAFVLVKLWLWFVVPFGIQAIGFAHALGISMLVAFLTYELNTPDSDKSYTELMILGMFKSVSMSLAAWGFGALYHSFM